MLALCFISNVSWGVEAFSFPLVFLKDDIPWQLLRLGSNFAYVEI
jgi:hypothetical protein